MSVDVPTGVQTLRELQDLIEALPECGRKAALRGMAAACVHANDPEVPADTLNRMTAVVRTWREHDPLARLDAELARMKEKARLC
jgi:hypothetical protein